MATLSFPLEVLQEAFGNCKVQLEKCDNDPRLSESDRIKLHGNCYDSGFEDDNRLPPFLCNRNVTTISIKNCPYTDFNIVLVHDNIEVESDGWTMDTAGPMYITNIQKLIDVSNEKIFTPKEGYESNAHTLSETENPHDNIDNNDNFFNSVLNLPQLEPQKSDNSYYGSPTKNNLLKIVEVRGGKSRCSGCNKIFSSFWNAKRHQIKTCPARFKAKTSLNAKHPSKSDHAGLTSGNISIFSEYLNSKNFKQKNGKFQCGFCKYWFKSIVNLQTHQISTCQGKGRSTKLANGMLKCGYCEKEFTTNGTLLEHVQISHMGMRQFECSICFQRFTRRSIRDAHMTVHTREKRFKCFECGKRFTRDSSLRTHKWIHTGIKKFGCSICGYKFTRRSNLICHMLVHTGERKFKCEICKKSFAQKKTLKDHMMVHSNVKPFKCPHCNLYSKRKRTIIVHIARFHSGNGNGKSNMSNKKSVSMP